MAAYYNEIDPFAAAWLTELIRRGVLPAGDVDTRSIEDVTPDDLRPYRQCHFFAGIGVWSWAGRCAGLDDDTEWWSGSCPCQPFSEAGQGAGFADERHLWPAWHWLIGERRPQLVFGEQVASKAGLGWLDLVSTDLEASGYAVGAVNLPACGIGAPHRRMRTFFMAHHHDKRRDRSSSRTREAGGSLFANDGAVGPLADDVGAGQRTLSPERGCEAATRGGLVVAAGEQVGLSGRAREPGSPGAWDAVDWIACKNGQSRPVEPGTFPLAHGSPNRVGRLRGYGNAIVAPLAQAFIEEALKCL